jgi:exodeoxyribonuclease V gamma subunit
MFILHSSNKTENLLAHLSAVFRSSSPASPFVKEIFLIQSQGMERWLSQQLATEFKVWANFEFLFPHKFFSCLTRQIDLEIDDSKFDRRNMLWHFEAVLRNLDDPCFAPLNNYLAGENSSLKRFQLAQQLTQIFDQYQMMRPDLLAAWQNNKHYFDSDTEHWQKALWQRIIKIVGTEHRGVIWKKIIKRLEKAEPGGFSSHLPERISIFGLNTMPPLFLAFLQALSRHCNVHFYLFNPAQAYWADLKSRRQVALEDQQPNGHPLLISLAQQGREFQEMLLEQTEFEMQFDSFEPVEEKSVLHQLQNDILQNQVSPEKLINDGSISIHSCHSRVREVQVMKNQLLDILENNSELQLRDIVVMAPDIQKYAAFINAVFSDIPHSIADRSLQLSNTLLDALLQFLKLSRSRFGWHAVLDLLEQPVVYHHFGLSETDLELIEHWVKETNIRWGRSAAHKAEIGLPETSENTWQTGLERLLMGYAIADDEFTEDILPYRDIEGSSAHALGGLYDFLQLLETANEDFKQAKTLQQWSERLFYFAEQLLQNEPFNHDNQVEWQQLNELISELSGYISEQYPHTVDLEVIISWLESTMTERKSSTGFLRGQLTFCSMLPMRSIPFKVIALLGMNDSEFPKIDRQPTFDLMVQDYRKGDRSRRADDRYQFLEILLSARQRLIMTYIGQSITHNESIPPSVVISELQEILEQDYQLENLIIRHPLQVFSPKYFSGENPVLFSYDDQDCKTAQALQTHTEEPKHWWQGGLQTELETIIDINDMFAFYRHPQEFFFRRQLGIRWQGVEKQADERERFAVDGLEAYQINQQWIAEYLDGKKPEVEKLQAQGLWLSQTPGVLEFQRRQIPIQEFIKQIQARKMGDPIPEIAIDKQVGGFRLVGTLNHIYKNGSLFYRYAKLKGKDFIQAWLHHLLVNQVKQQETCVISSDMDLLFPSETSVQEILVQLIKIYIEGQTNPHLFFVEPTFVYVQQLTSSKARKSPIDAARDELLKSVEYGFEPSMTKLYENIVNPEILLDDKFEKNCQTLLYPGWKAANDN